MVNSNDLKDLKAGSLVEVMFNDGPNRSGIVTNVSSAQRTRVLVRGHGSFALAVLIQMDNGSYRHVNIEHTQIVFTASSLPINLSGIVDNAKEAVMRWTCTIDDEESVALDFVAMTMPEDGFNLTSTEVAKLKSMQIGDNFVAGDEGQALIKRVA